MRELAKSIGSFSWAMSLFGARQLARVFRPSEAAEAFDDMTREASRHLGEDLESTFDLGDRMQRTMVDLTLGTVRFEAPDPDAWAKASAQMAEGFAEMARRMAEVARTWSQGESHGESHSKSDSGSDGEGEGAEGATADDGSEETGER